MDAMKYYESADRIIGKNIDMDAEKAANLGVFLNMEDYRYVADFYDAFHEVTADAIIYFGQAFEGALCRENRRGVLWLLWLHGFL